MFRKFLFMGMLRKLSCECFLLKSGSLRFTIVLLLFFGYGSNNDLDFEIKRVLTDLVHKKVKLEIFHAVIGMSIV